MEGLFPPSRSLLLETQGITTMGKKKLFLKQQKWDFHLYCLIPTIAYLHLVTLQSFRDGF